MIRAAIRMTIPSEKHSEALKILRAVADLCTDDPGCLGCNIYRDLHDSKVFVLEETWKTQEDLDLHLRTEEFRHLLLILEMSLKEPEIRFDTIMSSSGIETIERARGCTR